MTSKIIALVLIVFVFQCMVENSQCTIMSCIPLSGITENEAVALLHRNLTQITPKIKCFGACMVEDLHLIDGCNLKYEEAKLNFDLEGQSNMTFALDECKNSIHSSERCECGYELFKCMDDVFSKM
ncbi:general odorant-binding protein 56d-like [Episyrphus balteatus]|uniref:general odorant-binding protein 56d-like n=1 Tax=Episyrphus balteatus TaxID=286459 RepID=UPI002485B2A5|nr:general odorant-binding protein 56d-like [Episyrphus balteatus]XP_055856492.1 general odorant-binding protein 56d-like [Episyrphus balteatus]